MPFKKAFSNFFSAIMITALLLATLPAQSARAATITVSTCDYASLNTAITNATSGDTITFSCSGTINFYIHITLSKNLTIDAGQQSVVFDGGNSSRIFWINSGLTVSLLNLTFQNGSSVGIFAYGGAIDNSGTLTISNSTFSGNSASATGNPQDSSAADGGAIFNAYGGTLTISNSTFSGNSASATGGQENWAHGGAIYSNGTLTISNSTFSGNSASASGGETNDASGGAIDGNATLKNTILANNTVNGNPENCWGAITAGTDSLDSDGSCGGATTKTVAEIGLNDLADNGGPTQTMSLDWDSVALNNGDIATCAAAIGSPTYGAGGHDQRGVTRPSDFCDIGAYERDADGPEVTDSVPADGAILTTGPSQMTLTFNVNLNNAGGGTGADDAENPANYMLVEEGTRADFQTTSCRTSDKDLLNDTHYTVDSVTYTKSNYTSTLSINSGSALPAGSYRLFVCGTTSIKTPDNQKLNGGDFDHEIDFSVLESVPPTVTVEQASGQADPTGASPINFTAVFSEEINTSTFTAADITLGGTAPGTLSAVITQVSPPNDGTTFNIAVSGMADSGTVTASIAANKVEDLVGNNNTTSTSDDNEVTYDVTAPWLTVEQASGQADPTSSSPINFTAVFSEEINTSTFTAADITLGGTAPGTLSAVITQVSPPNGTTFNIAVNGMSDSGTVVASIAADKVEDLEGNNNVASSSDDNEVTYDITNLFVLSTTLEEEYSPTGPDNFTVTFNKNVYNPTDHTDPDDVTNPANYLLVEAGENDTFDTISCEGGLATDDSQITITGVSYNAATFTSTLSLNEALPVGSYRLFVCGTTSIVDLANNHLNGGTSDYTFDFLVLSPASLPATGFRHGRVTSLPKQPAAKAYTETAMMLEIPKLGVSMPIVGVPQSENGWDVSWLGNGAGYLAGSAFPTWAGNTVITGHVWDAFNQPGVFAEIKSLKYGDQIEIHAWGETYTYEVRESNLVTAKNVDAAFQSEQYDWVTLVTCEFYNPFNGEYLFRRAVRAVLVSVQ